MAKRKLIILTENEAQVLVACFTEGVNITLIKNHNSKALISKVRKVGKKLIEAVEVDA